MGAEEPVRGSEPEGRGRGAGRPGVAGGVRTVRFEGALPVRPPQPGSEPAQPGGGPVRSGAEPVPPEGRDVADAPTPPAGIASPVTRRWIVSDEDFGHAGPAVLGGEDTFDAGPRSEGREWPTLEYRSRNKPKRSGPAAWLRRRRDGRQ